MQIFLSYAAEDRALAEQVHLALTGHGHSVFFDRDNLPPGAEYHVRIRTAVESSDLFVFLVSPHSVEAGNYTLTELKYARDKWRHPSGHVLPVRVTAIPWDSVPQYLRAVTVLEPEGNIAAEVLDAVSKLDQAGESGKEAKLRAALQLVARDLQKQLEHFGREMSAILVPLDKHAKLIAENPFIVDFMLQPTDPSAQVKAHQVLSGHAEIGPYATTFLLDRHGVCIANSRHALSIGKDYSERPYFRDAMQNTVGRFPAIGVTSGVLGHHVAYPVHRAAEIVGVACVEVDMEHIATQSDAFVQTETGGADRSWIRVLTDRNGVIILSSEPSWLYRAVATIADGALEDIHRSGQYPGRDLAELERFDPADAQLRASSMPELKIRGVRWRDSFGDWHDGLFAIRQAKIVGDWRVLIFWRLNILA